jgi:hypothetical protein
MFRSASLGLLAALGLLVVAPGDAAARDDKSGHPGYVNVDWSALVGDRQPTVQVQLERPLLRLIAAASKEQGEDLDDLINQLAFVRVNVYDDLNADDAKVAAEVDARAADLSAKGWTSVAKVREDDQRVHVLMKSDDEKIVGFLIFVADDENLVFVNIAGDMDPETFGAKMANVAAKFSGGELNFEGLTDVLDSVKGETKVDVQVEVDDKGDGAQ